MKIDYEQIRKDNIRKHGEDSFLLDLLSIELYSDQTHFIFEILQNAEDADATRIHFKLNENCLEIRHDGRFFDEHDVRGVCGAGSNPKKGDLTKIGTFGIGFKSVFAFTTSPHIYCGDVNIEIKKYIRPYEIEPVNVGSPWTTLIVLPFDKTECPPHEAVSLIEERLITLTSRPLLFLEDLQCIEYELSDNRTGSYTKHSATAIDSSVVTVSSSHEKESQVEYEKWLVFKREILDSNGDAIRGDNNLAIPPIQIAFSLRNQKKFQKSKEKTASSHNKPWIDSEIQALASSPLIVFFPTEKETELGFLIQGPYRTTPARDNIPPKEKWNMKLINETAQLLVEHALPALKKMNLLTVDFFNALPIEMEEFEEDSLFYPIALAVKDTLLTQELLPSNNGKYIAGRDALLGRGEELRSLLDSRQLIQLFDLKQGAEWLSGEITADNAPQLRNYLREELDIIEVTPEILAINISIEFLEQQSDKWIAQFYSSLLGWESLWKSQFDYGRINLRFCPIIRLENGDHVTPFDVDRNPNAYLPLKGKTQLPIVRKNIVKNKNAKEFLIRLGLSEPDVVAEVIEEILPLYKNMDSSPSSSEHAKHMKVILAAWSTDSITKKARLERSLNKTPFVRYNCRANGIHGYSTPDDAYFPDEDLLSYFEEYEEAKFIITSYSKTANRMFEELGAKNYPRCVQVNYGDPPFRHRSTKKAIIVNYILEGLDNFLERFHEVEDADIKNSMSQILWRYLLVYSRTNTSCFQATRDYFYYTDYRQNYPSLLIKQLRETEWLPTSNGIFEAPPNISVDQLTDGFERDSKLINTLEIKPDPSEEIERERLAKSKYAKQLGIELEDAEFMQAHPDEFEEFKKTILQKEAHQASIDESISRNSERRRMKLKQRYDDAPLNKSTMKFRSTSDLSRSERDCQSLLDLYFDEDDEAVFCQMCLCLMPFVRRNGEEGGDCVTLFSKQWGKELEIDLKILPPLNLILCPVCSQIYRDYVHNDLLNQTALFEFLKLENEGEFAVCDINVRRDHRSCTLHFDENHLSDIRNIVQFMINK